MAKRNRRNFTEGEIQELRKNSNVKDVRRNRLTFTYEFRCKVYEQWEKNPSVAAVRKCLTDAGFNTRILGCYRINDLHEHFKRYGRPSRGRNKVFGVNSLNFKTNEDDNKFLISTGKFIEGLNGRGITFAPAFIEELYGRYPEQSIEDGIIAAGLDPEMVGYQRIYQLKNRFDENGPVKEKTEYSEKIQSKYKDHPYVEKVTLKQFRFSRSFYYFAFPLRGLHINTVLRAFEIDPEDLSISFRNNLQYKLRNMEKTNPVDPPVNERSIRILKNISDLLEKVVDKGFRELGELKKEMKYQDKKKLCRWIQGIPKDHGYTVTKILSLTGISRSSYYSTLSDDSYGKHQELKDEQDERDILIIREVMDHKGFKKGSRMINMTMKDITGKYFNRKKIQRLMRKFGVRSDVRESSHSRIEARKQLELMKKPNILKRMFRLHRPGEVTLSDVTYMDYGNGLRAYGSAAIDPVTGRCRTVQISEVNDLVMAENTLDDIGPAAVDGAIFHTDQGTLYLSPSFQDKLEEMGYTQSMSKRGNCWDNAPMESFFGHFKDEADYESCGTIGELKELVEEYVIYYNTERRQWGRNKMTPAEFERYLNGMDEDEYRRYYDNELRKYEDMKKTAAEKAKIRYESLGV